MSAFFLSSLAWETVSVPGLSELLLSALRREFRGFDQEYCAGALVWQMNDIWPGASWALVDVDLNPKPAFYVTKRALAKVVLGMSRIITKQPPYIVTGYLPEKHSVDIWAVNGTLERLDVTLNIRAYDIESGKRQPLPTEIESQRLDLPSNQALEITNISIPNAENTVIVGSLHSVFTGEPGGFPGLNLSSISSFPQNLLCRLMWQIRVTRFFSVQMHLSRASC